ncbi:MAG: hypothetical protein NC824_04400 [Candidatus Omnitrophica bacterium]|nr:hypothetical protein [Candidatus Omnitrophota bacterium]
MTDLRWETLMGRGPKKIVHWEHWSNPDAATYISGIDFYQHPKKCMEKVNEMYPFLYLPVPASDDPLPRPEEQKDKGKGRWGHTLRDYWQQEEAKHFFRDREEILKFSPLENPDFSSWKIPEAGDYRDEEKIYQRFRKNFPAEWDDNPPKCSWVAGAGFYNTMFMWPILVFGYENFLNVCLEPEFERIMEEFAEINRRVFRAIARLPVNWVCCHDDIVTTSGPLVSPAWMRKYIFPRYEEFWSILKGAGKEVIFMSDGCLDVFVDDLMSLGIRGIISEPYTDYKSIAKKYKDCFLAGEGDVRVLMENNPEEIKNMVVSMVETGKMCGGYMMCIGNHIPFNVPPPAVKLYFDLSAEIGYR